MEKIFQEKELEIMRVVSKLFNMREKYIVGKTTKITFNGPVTLNSIVVVENFIDDRNEHTVSGRYCSHYIITDKNYEPIRDWDMIQLNWINNQATIDETYNAPHEVSEFNDCYFHEDSDDKILILLYVNYDESESGDYEIEVFQLQ